MKNIVIVGGTHGIGLETARSLIKDHHVTILARTSKNLDELDCEYREFDVLKNDISEVDLPEEIHGLVYCPGSINLKSFKMLNIDTFRKEMEINFFSLVKVVHGLLPNLKKAEQASLVFFSTVAVKMGMPFHTSVAPAKAAIEGFAKALAAEFAPSLRVNVIAPSLTDTRLAEKLLNNEDKKKRAENRHPLKRIGKAGDIANLVIFLLSEKSSWMTGQVVGLDGGLSSINLN
jgi:NAD(P)-dependent dehydrogenase (short-subunit alcohol dehydrogenase family)